MPYTLFPSSCKADSLPFYSLLTLTAMLMSVSDIGTTATGTGYGWLLPALLVLCLAVIAVLASVIVRQRRLINLKNKYIARYAGQYLNLKYKVFSELSKNHPMDNGTSR